MGRRRGLDVASGLFRRPSPKPVLNIHHHIPDRLAVLDHAVSGDDLGKRQPRRHVVDEGVRLEHRGDVVDRAGALLCGELVDQHEL
jgi:hypothetical protein